MGFSTSGCKSIRLSIYSESMRLVISTSNVASLLLSRASVPLSASLTGGFGIAGVNDEIWAATIVVVLSRFQMYEDLISPTTFGGETWSVFVVRICREELKSMSL